MNISKVTQQLSELATGAPKKIDTNAIALEAKKSLQGLDLKKLKGVSADEFEKITKKAASMEKIVKPTNSGALSGLISKFSK